MAWQNQCAGVCQIQFRWKSMTLLRKRNKSKGKSKGVRKVGNKGEGDGIKGSRNQAPPPTPPPDAAPPQTAGCSAASGRQGPPRVAACTPLARPPLSPAGSWASRPPATALALVPRLARGLLVGDLAPQGACRPPASRRGVSRAPLPPSARLARTGSGAARPGPGAGGGLWGPVGHGQEAQEAQVGPTLLRG